MPRILFSNARLVLISPHVKYLVGPSASRPCGNEPYLQRVVFQNGHGSSVNSQGGRKPSSGSTPAIKMGTLWLKRSKIENRFFDVYIIGRAAEGHVAEGRSPKAEGRSPKAEGSRGRPRENGPAPKCVLRLFCTKLLKVLLSQIPDAN